MTEKPVFKTEAGRQALTDFHIGVTVRWAFAHESRTVPTRFGDTHVVTAGDSSQPALVLLHGSASNVLGWGAAIPQYSGSFYVAAPDIPGEAGRSAPVRPSWDNDDYVGWLDDVLDALEIGKASLLGLSFGGWVALKFAARRPLRVARMALLAPGGVAPARASAVLRTIVYSMQGRKGAEKLKRLVFGADEIPPEVSRFFDLLQEHFSPRFGSPRLLTDPELRAISCPVLMATGSRDAFFDAARSCSRLKALAPQAEVYVLGGGHGITEYGGRIADFLKS